VTSFSIGQASIDALMLWNDQLGCCGISAAYRALMLILFQKTGQVAQPTQAEFDAFYGMVGGYVPGRPDTDNGVDNPTLLQCMQNPGPTLAGVVHPFGPAATCSGADAVTTRKAIYYLLATVHGIDLPRTWYDSFGGYNGTPGSGNVWDATGGQIVGGHDVDATGFNTVGPTIVTWGGETQATWAGWAQHCTDVNGIADPNDTIDPKTGLTVKTGIPLAQWQADVAALTGGSPVTPPPPAPDPTPTPGPTRRAARLMHHAAEQFSSGGADKALELLRYGEQLFGLD
jgi:hypothetical protein